MLRSLGNSPTYSKCAFCGTRSNPLYLIIDQGSQKLFCCGCTWGNSHTAKVKNKPKQIDIKNEKILMVTKKPTPEEIIRKKEYVRFLNTQIYKLTSQQKFLAKQLTKLQTQLKDYEKEKTKTEK